MSVIAWVGDSFIWLVFLWGGIALWALWSYYLNTKNSILRELRKSKSKSISSIKNDEYAKVIGSIKDVVNPLNAPLSGRPCVYYHVLIEQEIKNGWKKIIDDKKAQDFFIEANGEMAIVRTNDAKEEKTRMIYLHTDHTEKSGFLNDASNKLQNYLRSHGTSSTGLFGLNRSLRYKEGIVAIGEEVVVKGVAQWKSLNEPIEGFSYSKVLTLSGNSKLKLIITDLERALEESR